MFCARHSLRVECCWMLKGYMGGAHEDHSRFSPGNELPKTWRACMSSSRHCRARDQSSIQGRDSTGWAVETFSHPQKYSVGNWLERNKEVSFILRGEMRTGTTQNSCSGEVCYPFTLPCQSVVLKSYWMHSEGLFALVVNMLAEMNDKRKGTWRQS